MSFVSFTASAILVLLHTAQAVFGMYNLYLSSLSIQNMLNYEDLGKKAAKHSQTAEEQLWKTRYTLASATVSVLLSFLSAVYLVFSTPSSSASLRGGLAILNAGVLEAARRHVGAFWKGKLKLPIPKTGDYNDAIGKTQEVRFNMAYLIASWLVVGVLGLVL